MSEIYTQIDNEQDLLSSTSTVTTGMWSGGAGSMTTFHTSSVQSGSTGLHYYDVYNGVVGTNATASVQFSATYGNFDGEGSRTGDNFLSPSKAIYRQLANLLLPQGTTKFQNAGSDIDDFFAISINRSRLKEKMDPGNWEIHLSGSTAASAIKLIDDSGATTDPAVKATQREFNIISGSIVGGTVSKPAGNDIKYGKFYPDTGILIIDPSIFSGTFFNHSTNINRTTTTVHADNAKLFFEAINLGKYFSSRREEKVTSRHYFCRITNDKYNYSQNPTYINQTTGDFTVPSFRTEPKSYITTVGLYNEGKELLAVAKLSKPVLKSPEREALIKVRLDF